MGSVILPAVIGDGSNLVVVGCVGLVLLAIVIVGLVLIIKNRKNISLLDGEIKLEKGTEFKTIWINVGMILYVAICLFSMISILSM